MIETRQALRDALRKLLRPLVRLLLHYGLPFGSFSELAKQVYVDVAAQEFQISGKKQTDSRISVLTGLTRKEVKQVKLQLAAPEEDENDSTARYNRAARVISGWIKDRSFLDGWGEPALLPIEGEGATFTHLVEAHSGDVPVRAILDELLRVEAIERLDDGRVRLLQKAYVPNSSEVDKLSILGMDTALLLQTISHNLQAQTDQAYFQRKVAYTNLPAEALPELHRLTHQHGQALLEELNAYLSSQDRDMNPHVEGTGQHYAGVGVYFFADPNAPELSQPDATAANVSTDENHEA